MVENFVPEFLFLSQEDVIAAGGLDMAATIQDVELAYKLFAAGETIQPSGAMFQFNHPQTGAEQYYMTVSMPAYVGAEIDLAGHKWYADSMANRNRDDVPTASAVILLHNFDHAIPLAIMEGGLLTAMRTSAAAGVGAKYLARSNSRVAGLIGAGMLGRTMIMALTAAMPGLAEIRLYNRTRARALSLAEDFQDIIPVRVVDSPQEACQGADIIASQTSARSPFVKDAWIPRGSYYAHMDPCDAEDAVFLSTDYLVVDHWEAMRTREDFAPARLMKNRKLTNLGEIVLGKEPGRTDPEQRIMFASLGMAALDIVVGKRIYENAKAHGLGQTLRLWEKPLWV